MEVKQKEFLLLIFLRISFIASFRKISALSTIKSLTESSAGLPENISVLPITLSPSHQDHYELILNNSGPVVLDSSITFIANLSNKNYNSFSELETRQYLFKWINLANVHMDQTVSSSLSEVSITFNSDKVLPGEYVMTVAAFPADDPEKIVAYDSTKFVLTDNLNGNLIVKQNLDYQRHSTVFATNTFLSAVVNICDKFLTQKNVKFHYFWYKNGDRIAFNETLIYNFTKAETFTLHALIGVDLNSKNKTDGINFTDMSKLDKVKEHDFNLEYFCLFSKCGQFEQFLILKDTLNSCYIKRVDFEYWDKGIALGKASVFNITCLGSSPTAVCYNVTNRNISIPSGQICLPITFHNTLHHVKTVHFLHVGWIDVHFFVYNDVSRIHLVESFYIYDGDTVNLPILIFPIVFGTLGILIILFGAAYIMRLHKKTNVEVADFDFHPTLTEKKSSEKFHTIIHSIKNMFSRNNYDHDHTDTKKCELNRSLRRVHSNCYDSL